MNVKIIGAGAIGSLLAGLLYTKKIDVCLTNNPAWEKSRTSTTIRLVLPDRWVTAEGICYDNNRKADFTFVCVKRHHLSSLQMEKFKENTEEKNGNIVFFNCSKQDTASLALKDYKEQLFALTLLSSVCLQPGDAELTSENSFIIFEKNKELKKILSVLKDFQIKLHMVDNIGPYLNSYSIFELLYLPVAMCNSTLYHFLSYREGRELTMRVLHEGIKTFLKSGKHLQKLPCCDPQDLLQLLQKKPDKFYDWRYKPDRSFNPVLQSMLLEKETEANEINGKLITMAKEAGVDSSWNWRLLQKIPRVKRFGFYPNPSELLKGI